VTYIIIYFDSVFTVSIARNKTQGGWRWRWRCSRV